MKKLIVAFHNFENAPKNIKKNVNLSYNIILSLTPFLLNALFHLPHTGFTGTNTPHILFLEEQKKKNREIIKLIPRLAFILIPKKGPTMKIKKKKVLWSGKG